MTRHSATTRAAPPKRPPGRPSGGPVIDRDELLDAAVRVIEAVGPTATLEAIATEAGITKPTVYRVLGDRAAIVTALAEHLVDLGRQAVAATQQDGSTMPARQQFRATIGGFLHLIDQRQNLFLFVNASGHDAELLGRLIERSAVDLVALFADARTSAGRDPVGSRTWAYGVIGALQASVTMWIQSRYCSVEELAEALTQLLWDGMSTILSDP